MKGVLGRLPAFPAVAERLVLSGLLVLTTLSATCAAEPAPVQPLPKETARPAMENQRATTPSAASAAVLDRNMRAFAARDVDALLENYTDESVLIAQDKVYGGKAQIRSFFEQLMIEFASPQTTLTLQQRHVQGPIAFIAWTAQTPARRYELGTDTFYIANDRILYQTFAFKASPK